MAYKRKIDPVEYHNANANSFRQRYDEKSSFKKRLSFWVELFQDYIVGNNNIIELGCGPGLMAKELLDMGNHVDAVDGSGKMIKKAKEYLGDFSDINFVEGYISKDFLSQFAESQYDHVISSSVLEYIKDFDIIVNEVQRILKPEGFFIFSIPNKQSVFRFIESLAYYLFGKPAYREILYTQKTENDIKELTLKRWKVEKLVFHGEIPFYSKATNFLPDKFQKPMIIVVLKNMK